MSPMQPTKSNGCRWERKSCTQGHSNRRQTRVESILENRMPTLLEGSALDQQLQLFEQQVDGLSARVDEDDLVSVVNLGLAIFQQIRRLEDRIARGASPIDSKKIEQARSVANLYTHWYQSASILRKVIKSRTGADWTIL